MAPSEGISYRLDDGTVLEIDESTADRLPRLHRNGIDLGDGSGTHGSGGGEVPSSVGSAVGAGFGSADEGEFGTGTYQDPFPADASDGGTAGGGTAGAGGQSDGAGDHEGPTSAQSASDAGFGDPWAGEFGGSPGAEPVPPPPVPPPRVVAVDPSGLYRPVDGDSVPTSYIVTLSDGTRLNVGADEVGAWEAAVNGGGGERTWTDTDGVTYTRFANGSVLAVQPSDSNAWVPPQLHLPAAGGGNNGGKPLLIDLDGDGLEILGLTDDAAVDAANADLARLVGRSRALYDLDGDGMVEPTAWLAPDDGLIAYDADGDGRIAGRAELVLADWADDRFATDLDGLAAFDSDGDGRFTPADAEWGAFRLWQDRDGDGTSDTGELTGLTEAGLTAIDLTGSPVIGQADLGGARLLATTSASFGDGRTVLVGDALLGFEALGVSFADEDPATGGGRRIAFEGGGQWLVAGSTAFDRAFDGAAGLTTVTGSAGDDRLIAGTAEEVSFAGGVGNDVLTGGAGDDWLSGGAGADTLDGGDGDDTLFVDLEDLEAGSIEGGPGFDTLIIEDLTGFGVAREARIAMFGDVLDLQYDGLLIDMFAWGLNGLQATGFDDVVIYRDRAPDGNLALGAGDDRVFVDHRDHIAPIDVQRAGLTVDGGDGRDDIMGGNADDRLIGGDGIDRLHGWHGRDVLDGGGGDDSMIDGGLGDDVLFGEAGDDFLQDRYGHNIMVGGAGRDVMRGRRADRRRRR